MTLRDVLGQRGAIDTLVRAIEGGRAHHAYRFEGPEGVGKELAAFGFAQAFTCTESSLGCGACDACRRTTTRSDDGAGVPLHPDVVLVERGLYDGNMRDDRGKRIEEKNEIGIQQVRQIIQAQVTFTPSEARARVFIVRRAHELSISAANALLKTLEEPRPGTHFVLLTSRPDKLLPTIRSRTLPVRFGPLPDDVLLSILGRLGVAADVAAEVAPLAEGSVSAALEHADPERATRRREFFDALLAAAATRHPGSIAAFAESLASDRGSLKDELLGVAARLARRTREIAAKDADAAARWARAYDLVLATVTDLETANASAVLSMGRLALDLGRLAV